MTLDDILKKLQRGREISNNITKKTGEVFDSIGWGLTENIVKPVAKATYKTIDNYSARKKALEEKKPNMSSLDKYIEIKKDTEIDNINNLVGYANKKVNDVLSYSNKKADELAKNNILRGILLGANKKVNNEQAARNIIKGGIIPNDFKLEENKFKLKDTIDERKYKSFTSEELQKKLDESGDKVAPNKLARGVGNLAYEGVKMGTSMAYPLAAPVIYGTTGALEEYGRTDDPDKIIASGLKDAFYGTIMRGTSNLAKTGMTKVLPNVGKKWLPTIVANYGSNYAGGFGASALTETGYDLITGEKINPKQILGNANKSGIMSGVIGGTTDTIRDVKLSKMLFNKDVNNAIENLQNINKQITEGDVSISKNPKIINKLLEKGNKEIETLSNNNYLMKNKKIKETVDMLKKAYDTGHISDIKTANNNFIGMLGTAEMNLKSNTQNNKKMDSVTTSSVNNTLDRTSETNSDTNPVNNIIQQGNNYVKKDLNEYQEVLKNNKFKKAEDVESNDIMSLDSNVHNDTSVASNNSIIQQSKNYVNNDKVNSLKSTKIDNLNKTVIPISEEVQLKNDIDNFRKQVDDYVSGSLKSGNVIRVGKTPKVLKDIGLPNSDIVLKQSKLKTILKESDNPNSNEHGIPAETVKEIPRAISEPLNVLKSSTRDDSIVIVTDLADKLDRPIMVSIEIGYEGQIGNIKVLNNRLTSAYGKRGYDRFMIDEIKKGNLLYDIDEGIIKELSATGLQLSKGTSSQASEEASINNIIPFGNNYVNSVKNSQESTKVDKLKENKTFIPFNREIEPIPKHNIIDEKVAEYVESIKDNFETNIDINTKVVNEGNVIPVDYKKEKQATIYKRARDIFGKIGKKVFTNKNDSEKIYVSNTDINESIRKTITNPEQNKYLDENIAIFSQLDSIIENGKEISSSVEDTKGREYKDYKYYVVNVRINGEDYVVEFDTRIEEHNKINERHFRLERLYKVNEGDLATGADIKSPNQFGTKSPSINNIIQQDNNYVNSIEKSQKSVKKIPNDYINTFIKEENNQMKNSLSELKKVVPIKEKTKTAIPVAKNIREVSNLTNSNSIDYNTSKGIGDENGRQRESDSRSIRKTDEYNKQGGSKSNITNSQRESIDSRYGKDDISQKTISELLTDEKAKRNTIEYAKKNKINELSAELLKFVEKAEELGINLVFFNGKKGNNYLGLMKDNEMYLDLNKDNISLEDGSLEDRFYHEVFHYLKRNTSFKNSIQELQINVYDSYNEAIEKYIKFKSLVDYNFDEDTKIAMTEEILADYCAKYISGYKIDYDLPEEITYSLNQTIEDALVELKLNNGNIIKKDNKIDTNTFVKRQKNTIPISKEVRLKKDIELFYKAKGNISRDVVRNIANSLDIKVKSGAQKIQNTNMESLSGKNKNPKIISIDNIFEGVDSKNVKSFRGKAISKALELFRDKKVIIKDTGTIAEINKHGIEKTYSGNITPEKIQTTNNIKDIIEEGIYGYTTQNPNDRDEILYHHFFTPIESNGKNGLIRVVIKEYTQNKTMNDKYYYHQLEIIDGNNKEDNVSILPRKNGSKTGDTLSSINNIIQQDNNYVNSTENSQESTKIDKNNNSKDEFISPTIDKISESRTKNKVKASELKDLLAQKLVNKGHTVDKLAKATNNPNLTHAYDRTLSAFAEGNYSIGEAQTNNKGEEIGKSIKDIFKPAEDKKVFKEFNDYLLNRHNIDRFAVEKSLYSEDITPEKSRKIIKEYEEKYPEFKEWAEDVYNFNRNELQNIVDAGFIDSNSQEYLTNLYGSYVPTFRDIIETAKNLEDKTTGANNPIKSAKGGTEKILNIKDAMAEQVIRTKKAIRMNELGLELAKSLGEKSILDPNVEITFSTEAIMSLGGDVVTYEGDKPIFKVFKDGQAKELAIGDDLYDSLKKDTIISYIQNSKLNMVAEPFSKATSFYKELLTTYNIGFAFNNAIKDFQDSFFNTKFDPVTYAKNYTKALYQIGTKGEYHKKYLANGGAMNTYFEYGTGVLKDTKNPVKKFVQKIQKVNEIIEEAPRLAEFISTLEKGGTISEAMYNAADITTNFKRGGEVTKALNKYGANFLNASVQGLDKTYRTFKGEKGWKGYARLLMKVAMLSVMPSVLNHLLLRGDEEYEALPYYIKDEYYLFKKDNGKFVRIPKGRIISVIGSTARRFLEASEGKGFDLEGLVNTTKKQLAPNNPFEDNILAPIGAVKTNKAWHGGDIVPSRLQKQLPKNQYDEKTDEISKWLGNIFNYSPKKINYLIDQYSGGIGDVVLPMFTPQAENNILEDKFTTDSVLKNKYVGEFYDKKDELEKINNDVSKTYQDEVKYKYLNSVSEKIGKLYNQKREVQMSKISDKEKKETVRDIQKEINWYAENTLKNVNGNMTEEQEWDMYIEGIFSDNIRKEDKSSDSLDAQYAVDNGLCTKREYIDLYKKTKENKQDMPTIKYLKKMEEIGLDIENYVEYKINTKGLKSDKDEKGKAINTSLNEKEAKVIMKMKISDKQKDLLFEITNKTDDKPNVKDLNKLNGNYLTYMQQSGKKNDKGVSQRDKYMMYVDTGIPVRTLNKYYDEIGKIEGVKGKNGKTISGSKKRAIFKYINSLPLSAVQKKILFTKSNASYGKSYKREIFNYINKLPISKARKEQIWKELYD